MMIISTSESSKVATGQPLPINLINQFSKQRLIDAVDFGFIRYEKTWQHFLKCDEYRLIKPMA